MSEPLKPEKISQGQGKASPFSDPNVSSEDNAASFDMHVTEILERPRKNDLSENDPDKVLRGWSPMNEKIGRRGFHYYIQRLDGKTPLWNEMIDQLKPDKNYITGVIYKDDVVAWSGEAAVHSHIISASIETDQETRIVGVFQCRYDLGQAKPRLTIYCDDPNGGKFGDYLRKNLDSQTPLSVWVAPREARMYFLPHEMPLRSS